MQGEDGATPAQGIEKEGSNSITYMRKSQAFFMEMGKNLEEKELYV